MRLLVTFVAAAFAALLGCGGGGTVAGDLATSAVDVAQKAPGFGEPCDPDHSCDEGLFCLPGPSGGAFCSKTCQRGRKACDGAPLGTAAYCLVTDVDGAHNKGCAFVCAVGGVSYDCPGQLACAADEDPPGSGQRLCLP